MAASPKTTKSRDAKPAASAKREDVEAGLESFSPATGELLGSVETLTPGKVQGVVDDVAEVQPFWAQLSLADRARYMLRAADVLLDEVDELAELLSREQGKPRVECYSMELLPTVDALHWIADAGPDILADERQAMPQAFLKMKRSKFVYEPLGVVGVIAPWNYPWSIPFGEVAIALMAGNGVVLKPASLTPVIGEQIRAVFERAGLPEGLVRTVHGGGKVGQALVESSAAKIFFTGSVEVGRGVGIGCAERMKGCVLELGGKDPQIVLADANIQNAIAGCLWGGFANAGQTCSGIERVYVVEEVAERFIEGVVEGARALRVGDPLEYETEIGRRARRRGLTSRRQLLRAGRADRRHARHADHARGDLRPGRPDRDGGVRGRGDRARQRVRVRARSLGVDHEPGQGRADRRAPGVGHGLDQRPHVQPRRLLVLVGRREGIRPRALALEVRALGVREHQAGHLGALAHARFLVAPLRRLAR